MFRRALLVAVVALVAVWAAAGWWLRTPGLPVAAEPGVALLEVFGDLRFDRPVHFGQAPGDDERAFVALQGGRVLSLDRIGPGAEVSVHLDLGDRVRTAHNEEGLLGMAFDPAFERTGAVYVYYSASRPRRTVLARFAGGRETVLLEIEQPYGNHNGGMIAFGPDGLLYVGVGDGGAAGDPEGNGQDRGTLLGAILRLDVSTAAGGRPYAIPPDNPFVGVAGARPEIYAYGLRNPWRFSFDPVDGRLWVGDVGQNRSEEIDLVTSGGNYGWPVREGDRPFDPTAEPVGGPPIEPVAAYDRRTGRSVTGGVVYRGREIEHLVGRYLYGDYVTGRLLALTVDDAGRLVENVILLETGLSISSFGVDAAGEVYLCHHADGIGRIVRLVAE